MSVKTRLKCMGSKKHPFYQIVIAGPRAPRDGRLITSIDTYNPLAIPKEVKFDEDAVMEWLQKGTQPSDAVRNMLQAAGVTRKCHETKYARG